MKTLVSFATAGLLLLAGGNAAQAQHFHGHTHYHHGHHHHGHHHHGHHHHGHNHLHGHWHYPSYYNYGSYWRGNPYFYGSSGSFPAYYDLSVVTNPVFQPAPTIVSAGGVTTTTALKPNVLPPYTGPGVTLRLPADYSGPVYVRIDNRDIELKPGTEVILKDKPACLVEFDRGGEFGATRHKLSEGSYKMTVGTKGWQVLPDSVPSSGGLRPNTLPGEPKK